MYQKLKDCNIVNFKVIDMNYKLDIIDQTDIDRCTSSRTLIQNNINNIKYL